MSVHFIVSHYVSLQLQAILAWTLDGDEWYADVHTHCCAAEPVRKFGEKFLAFAGNRKSDSSVVHTVAKALSGLSYSAFIPYVTIEFI
jgi:hypothetical protein